VITACIIVLTATKRWSRPPVSGDMPGARDGHSSCVIRDKMFVFGGYEESVSYLANKLID